MSTNEKPRYVTLELRSVEAPAEWESWVAGISEQPVRDSSSKALRAWFCRLVEDSLKTSGLSAEIALQINELHLNEGAEILEENCVKWLPQMGLGIFPDQDPPRPWTPEDFEAVEMDPAAKVRTLMHQVMRLAGAPEDRLSAREEMPGRGAYVEMHARRSDDDLLEALTAASQDKIADRMFSGFPFLFPLLNSRSLATLTGDDLERRLAGAEFYARDSASDGGLFLARKGGMTDLFETLGGERQENGTWKFEWPVS